VVESAACIARRLGLSELVIGLTIVAIGTSSPEFAVTVVLRHGDD
jgi:cation:H+ antiporter